MNEAFKIIKESGVENAIIVGDYNFDSKMREEEKVISESNMRDIVHDFFDETSFSMMKTKRFSAWRPDKMVCKVD